jgi:cytochrome c-type biogenesis protein CcmF
VAKSGILGRVLILGTFISLTISLAIIVVSSLLSDFTYRYVWDHSSTGLSTIYKLSAVWAGGGGSLLLCTWLMALVLVYVALVRGGPREASSPFRSVLNATLSFIVAFFSINVLASGLFDRTEEALLSTYPDGRGLDLLLQTPEMVVHAPLIFGAYASMCAVFASSVSFFVTGERRWHRVSLPWGRLAWVLLTSGIVIGAYWAYYVIGWGGYWSWDPVETASLIPWLLLTAFLHTQDRHMRRGEYQTLCPMFGMLSLAGVAFVSFVVRAGGLWSYSVHDYGASSSSPAIMRFVELLQDDMSVAGTFAFVIVLLAVTLLLTVRSLREVAQPEAAATPRRLSGYITDQNNMLLAVTLFSLAALVAVALMVKNIESGQNAMAGELGSKMTVMAAVLMASMNLCLVWRSLGRERALHVIVALMCASLALAIASAATGAVDGVVAFALPSFISALVVSGFRFARSLAKGSIRTRLFRAGAQLVHVGAALVLTAFVVSSNMQSYPSTGNDVYLHVGSQVQVGDYSVMLTSLETLQAVSGYAAEVALVRVAYVDVYKDGEAVAEGARLELLYGVDYASGYYVLERVPYVQSSLVEDLYVSFEWAQEEVALVHAKVVPMMQPLWVGCLLLVLGFMVRFSTSAQPSRPFKKI